MKRLTTLILLLPVLAFAGETFLVCEGETLEIYPGAMTTGLSDEITLAISDKYVVASDIGRVEYLSKNGIIWEWSQTIEGEAFAYNLDTISGRLKKTVTNINIEKMKTIWTYQCRKVKQRLIE